MPRLLPVLLLFVLPAAAEDNDAAPPAWYLEEIATLTAGSGRWTPNRSYTWKRSGEPAAASSAPDSS